MEIGSRYGHKQISLLQASKMSLQGRFPVKLTFYDFSHFEGVISLEIKMRFRSNFPRLQYYIVLQADKVSLKSRGYMMRNESFKTALIDHACIHPVCCFEGTVIGDFEGVISLEIKMRFCS